MAMYGPWKCQEKPVRLRITHLGRPGRRYITARCAKPDIPPIRYLFAEEEGADGASEFISLWQPYEGEPFIQKLERLTVEGPRPAGEFAPVALRVTLAGGQVDTLYSWDRAPFSVPAVWIRGSFGYWSKKEGVLRALHLVNGAAAPGTRVFEIPPAFPRMIGRIQAGARSRLSPPRDLIRPGQLLYLQEASPERLPGEASADGRKRASTERHPLPLEAGVDVAR